MNKIIMFLIGCFLLGLSLSGFSMLISNTFYSYILSVSLGCSIILFFVIILRTIEEKTIEYHVTNYYTYKDYQKGGKDGRTKRK